MKNPFRKPADRPAASGGLTTPPLKNSVPIVRIAYQMLLKRDPEQAAVDAWNLGEAESDFDRILELRDSLWNSEEFQITIRKHLADSSGDIWRIVNYPDSNGFKWILRDLSWDPISQRIFSCQPFEEADELLDLLSDLPRGSQILDIGANLGVFTFHLANRGYRLYSVEASANNAECLRMTSLLNHFDVTVCEWAAFEKTGSIFFVQRGPWGEIHLTETPDSEEITCYALDDYRQTDLAGAKISFIKMDIEGSEPSVIRGARGFLAEMNYPPVYCERNNLTLLSHRDTRTSYFAAFSAAGYRPYVLQNGHLLRFDPDTLIEELSCDYVFLHDQNPFLHDKIKGKYRPEHTEQEVLDAITSHDIGDIEYVLGQTANLRGSRFETLPEVKAWTEKVKSYYQNSGDYHVSFLYPKD